jgi:hypothetical protein
MLVACKSADENISDFLISLEERLNNEELVRFMLEFMIKPSFSY